jgi:triacylglycerol esterase/lipase EstA (alpha/beta hydrolase family)
MKLYYIKNLVLLCILIIIAKYLTIDSDISNILYLTTPIITKKLNLKGDLTKDKLYHNLYSFLFNRLEEQFIKIMVKITITDHLSRKRIVSLTKFIFINKEIKNDIHSFITHTLTKFNKYMDHYHPISINGLFVDYLPIDEKEYLDNSISNP